jgi:hypothetical protein
MDTARAIANLSKFVVALSSANVTSRKEYYIWTKQHPELMGELFEYRRLDGMPDVRALVRPFFHPDLPLVGLNYSPVAHNTLHAFPDGWTDPLRQCRGIVFDRLGKLVAKPFPKFFNYGEHPETKTMPGGRFDATEKHDGHLGIIFNYERQFYLTTRGDFTSPTSRLGNEMLAAHAGLHGWSHLYPRNVTVLTEIIHPQTKVHRDYGNRKEMVIIGAYNLDEYFDFSYDLLLVLGKNLRLPVTDRWEGKSLRDLRELMKDRSVHNREGYVVRFRSNNLRVKFKYESYIGMMVEDKLSYTYLMNRELSGNREKMTSTLPEEVFPVAEQMWAEIQAILDSDGTPKAKWTRLYGLVPAEKSTAYYKGICRKLVKKLCR